MAEVAVGATVAFVVGTAVAFGSVDVGASVEAAFGSTLEDVEALRAALEDVESASELALEERESAEEEVGSMAVVARGSALLLVTRLAELERGADDGTTSELSTPFAEELAVELEVEVRLGSGVEVTTPSVVSGTAVSVPSESALDVIPRVKVGLGDSVGAAFCLPSTSVGRLPAPVVQDVAGNSHGAHLRQPPLLC